MFQKLTTPLHVSEEVLYVLPKLEYVLHACVQLTAATASPSRGLPALSSRNIPFCCVHSISL